MARNEPAVPTIFPTSQVRSGRGLSWSTWGASSAVSPDPIRNTSMSFSSVELSTIVAVFAFASPVSRSSRTAPLMHSAGAPLLASRQAPSRCPARPVRHFRRCWRNASTCSAVSARLREITRTNGSRRSRICPAGSASARGDSRCVAYDGEELLDKCELPAITADQGADGPQVARQTHEMEVLQICELSRSARAAGA